MSTEKKIPPIQLAPVQHFTVRLIDGHFVRVPKVENIAPTDATRPPSTVRESFPHGDGENLPRGLHLENGRFVNGLKTVVPVQIPPTPEAGTVSVSEPAKSLSPAPPAKPVANPWGYAFITELDPSDSPPKT